MTPENDRRRLYYDSAGICRAAVVISEHDDDSADLLVLHPDGGAQPSHRIPHGGARGAWEFIGDDPGEGAVREGGRPVEVGAEVVYLDQRGRSHKALIAGVRLVGFGRRAEAKVRMLKIDGDLPGIKANLLARIFTIPEGDRGPVATDFPEATFGSRPGQWCWPAA